MTDRRIVGSIDVRQAGRLILSVPADEGWTLYVDGKKTKIKPFADALIGVHLKEGTHKIELRYTTPGVQIGAAISIAALLLFLFSMWIRYKIRGKYGEKCISIVVPMYNEQESLQILYRELNRVTREMGDYDLNIYLSMTDRRMQHCKRSGNLQQKMSACTIFLFPQFWKRSGAAGRIVLCKGGLCDDDGCGSAGSAHSFATDGCDVRSRRL